MPDILDKICTRAVAYLCNHPLSFIAITGINAHLDQLMVLKRQVNFMQYGIRDTGIPGQYDGFQVMRASFQKSLLVIGNHE